MLYDLLCLASEPHVARVLGGRRKGSSLNHHHFRNGGIRNSCSSAGREDMYRLML